MFELAPRLLARLDAGERLVLATAVSVTGSAPRGVGTSMAILPDGAVVGTISGGCVEGAVYEIGTDVLRTGVAVLERFGFSDDEAWAVGLSCGGRIEVLLRVVSGADAEIVDALRTAAAGGAASVTLSLAAADLGDVVSRPEDCAGRVFTERSACRPRLLLFGAVEFAVALTDLATTLGHAVTVCDPRPVFLTRERFPRAAALEVAWPTRYLESVTPSPSDAVVVLAHDDRFDVSLLDVALRGDAGYVGAMGSRTTDDRRREALGALGTPGLDRLRSPIGLDLGARTPEETAVSIMAEVIAARTGGTGAPLHSRSGAIHRARVTDTRASVGWDRRPERTR